MDRNDSPTIMFDFQDESVSAGDDPFQSADPAPANAGAEPTGSTDAASQPAPTDGQATAADQGDGGIGTSQQPDPNAPPAPPSEDELAKMEQEVEAALADERTPKWFRNAVDGVYKPKLDTLGKQVEQYSALGTPEQIQERVGLTNDLFAIVRDPQTGMPVKTTEGFVDRIYKQDPEVAARLMYDLGRAPSPDGKGTMVQALLNNMGIDLNRLGEIQSFAQNGYQLQAAQYALPDPADLAMIPAHLQATFAKLDPETRESLMGDNDTVRTNNLEAHRYKIETTERQQAEEAQRAQTEEQQTQQRQAEFRAQVDAKGQENFAVASEGVLKSFVDSLAKQAGMSQLDALMIANTVLNAFEPTTAGQLSVAALKSAGIEIDSTVQQTILELQESASFLAYHELVGDKASVATEAARQAELQQKLTAKGNKIIAALAVKRNGSIATPARTASNQLALNADTRYAAAGAGVPSNGAPAGTRPTDYSDESYAADFAAEMAARGRS